MVYHEVGESVGLSIVEGIDVWELATAQVSLSSCACIANNNN